MPRFWRRPQGAPGAPGTPDSVEVEWSSGAALPPHSGPYLLGMLVLAGALFVAAEHVVKPWNNVAEHTGSALIAAVVIAFTYEYLLHAKRERMFRQLFDEHRERMFDTLKVHLLLTPEEIFHLIADIAVQTSGTPTLYRPPRASDEYTFANSIDYFTTLVEVRRKDVVGVLKAWIEEPSKHVNLKFLGSDFIGMYRLHELATELREQATRELDHLDEANRGWVLNYIWAASRCEATPYRWLGEVLRNTDDPEVQKWILFVPVQMAEEPFVEIIHDFLNARGADAGPEVLEVAARALAAIERRHPHLGRTVLQQHRKQFERSAAWPGVRKSWQDLGLEPKRTLAGKFLPGPRGGVDVK